MLLVTFRLLDLGLEVNYWYHLNHQCAKGLAGGMEGGTCTLLAQLCWLPSLPQTERHIYSQYQRLPPENHNVGIGNTIYHHKT